MTREGYNTRWIWKEWSRECSQAVEAMKINDYSAAEEHLERARACSRQLDLWEADELEAGHVLDLREKPTE